jgi:enoyl-CoA hydratase/carnithine racemase
LSDNLDSVLHSVQKGRLLHLTLNRPDKRNALDRELCRRLVQALEQADADPAIGAILLDGHGKSFCAGMDLDQAGQADQADQAASGNALEINTLHERLFTIGARLGKPLVAAVHGAALGGGTGLVANCHIVVAAENATFGLTEIRLGLWPFLVFRAVAAAMGERRTIELALSGRTFDAKQAREFGLVHETTAADALSQATEVAQTVANFSPTAIQSGLWFVREVRGQNWEQAGEIARRVRDQVFQSADFQEGVRAWREKRAPRWPSISGPPP